MEIDTLNQIIMAKNIPEKDKDIFILTSKKLFYKRKIKIIWIKNSTKLISYKRTQTN
jgi:hypothetical protein